jgi:hypothetical protein
MLLKWTKRNLKLFNVSTISIPAIHDNIDNLKQLYCVSYIACAIMYCCIYKERNL